MQNDDTCSYNIILFYFNFFSLLHIESNFTKKIIIIIIIIIIWTTKFTPNANSKFLINFGLIGGC